MTQSLKNKILKGVLLLLKVNSYVNKDDEIENYTKYLESGVLSESDLDEWIESLQDIVSGKEESSETYEDEDDSYLYDYEDDYYTPSATNRDYGPSNPWDAPGMSVRDFI